MSPISGWGMGGSGNEPPRRRKRIKSKNLLLLISGKGRLLRSDIILLLRRKPQNGARADLLAAWYTDMGRTAKRHTRNPETLQSLFTWALSACPRLLLAAFAHLQLRSSQSDAGADFTIEAGHGYTDREERLRSDFEARQDLLQENRRCPAHSSCTAK